MACEVQTGGALITLANAVSATPGVAFGTVAPPLEPVLAAKMWLSWLALLFALKALSDCLEQNGRGEDAKTLRREIDRLRGEMDDLKRRVQ